MSDRVLICAQPLGNLGAREAGVALARGFSPPPDVLELPVEGDVAAVLAAGRFDERMRAAFAVVIACGEPPADLRGTFAGEVATRARQSGFACHMVCAGAPPDPFTARIYDLQTIHVASTPEQLEATARALTSLF